MPFQRSYPPDPQIEIYASCGGAVQQPSGKPAIALLASIIAAHGGKAEKWNGLVKLRDAAGNTARSKRFSRAFAMWPLSTAITGKLKTRKYGSARMGRCHPDRLHQSAGPRQSRQYIGWRRCSIPKTRRAVRLLEFLTEKTTAQKLYGEINYEFPVNPSWKQAKKSNLGA